MEKKAIEALIEECEHFVDQITEKYKDKLAEDTIRMTICEAVEY